MDDNILVTIALVFLVLVIFSAIILIILFSVFFTKKKQKEYVLQTSTRLKQLELINQQYKKQFGCLSKCDIEAPISFKYKRTL